MLDLAWSCWHCHRCHKFTVASLSLFRGHSYCPSLAEAGLNIYWQNSEHITHTDIRKFYQNWWNILTHAISRGKRTAQLLTSPTFHPKHYPHVYDIFFFCQVMKLYFHLSTPVPFSHYFSIPLRQQALTAPHCADPELPKVPPKALQGPSSMATGVKPQISECFEHASWTRCQNTRVWSLKFLK